MLRELLGTLRGHGMARRKGVGGRGGKDNVLLAVGFVVFGVLGGVFG